jgi:hypothetical protein
MAGYLLRSFHLSLLVKQNVYHHPHSNPSHVPLAIQMLFSIVIENQHWSYTIGFVLWTCPKHRLWRPRRILLTSMETSLLRSLMFHVHFQSLQSSFYLVSLVPMGTTTYSSIVVDAYVYHKYCRSHGCIVVLTLQLER